jgi:cell shape-determining protein MreC
MSPIWISGNKIRSLFLSLPTLSTIKEEKTDPSTIKQLKLENKMLRNQIEALFDYLLNEERINEQIQFLKNNINEAFSSEFFKRRASELKKKVDLQIQALPAKVIFRDPSSYSSSIWIDVGEKQNQILGKKIVSKNSPVVVGDSLIGVVEIVEKKRSQVRLITDSGLIPSVRVVRGKEQNKVLIQLLKNLIARIDTQKDISKKEDIIKILNDLTTDLSKENNNIYLAKGQLQGSAKPLFRSNGHILKGIGFNYSFSDEHGSARDLKTGALINNVNDKISIIEEGDLLVTTGLDGVFPKNLHVAIVSKKNDLQDGDYAYEIEAKPTCEEFDELKMVFVLPAL